MSWWSDLVEAVTSAAGGEQQAELVQAGAPNVQTPWTSVLTLMEGYWAGLTDGKLWRSLGWIILGIVMMLLGVAIWVTGQRNPVSIARQAL
jgi:hypothetical protein